MHDYTNQRFGRLVVIERNGSKNNRVVWKCKCDCGNNTFASRNGLTCGDILSCGCLHKELSSEMMKKRNKVQKCADRGKGNKNV